MPKILTIGHSYVVGLNRRLPQEWAKAGWDVTVVAPTRYRGDLGWLESRAEPGEAGVLERVPVTGARLAHGFYYGDRLRELLSQEWDIVHIWEEPFVFASWRIARWAHPQNKLVWATFQNLPKHYPPPFSWMESQVLQCASGWIAFGQTIRQNLEHRAGYQNKPHRVIPPGVDTALFRPQAEKRKQIQDRFGWPEDVPVVGFVGRWVAEKGIEFLMHVLDQWDHPWRALFLGGGELEPEIREWAARWPGRVECCQDISHDHVADYLNAMDVAVLPSRTTRRWQEQFGRILIEAMACGVPVVGSRSGEIPYVIGETGWVVDENDVSGWTQALQAAVSAVGRQRGREGIERMQNNFSWRTVAQQHLEFFAEL